jgi:lipid A biosynthesis lauroyl/palmitoleoyl acyltransferase
MSDLSNQFEWRFVYHPRFWPTWMALALLRLSVLLPYRVLLYLGNFVGLLVLLMGTERRRITRTNLRLCFPQLDSRAQRRILRESFYSIGIALFESALSWWGSNKKLQPLFQVQGLEHLRHALQDNKGVLLLSGHYTTLEIGGRIMAPHATNLRPTYKRTRDPLFNWMMTRARIRVSGGLVNSANMREILRELKNNNIIWYAPDQDFGLKSSVFAPFMGIVTATLTLPSRLAKLSGAPVLPWYCERLPRGQGYRVRIEAPLANFPSGDDVTDAATVNAIIETQVRRTPGQYLWGHRRFKTRPLGEPMVYAPRRDWRLRRYSTYNLLLAVPLLIYTVLLAYRNRDLNYLKQRLGFYSTAVSNVDLWFHAASVGEVIALLPLLEQIQLRQPERKIMLSTFTPTGGKTARQYLPPGISHCYLPIDGVWCVKRFLDQFKPRCAIFMETELWPNLHEYCYNYAIPVLMVNGRLSERSFKSPNWLRQLTCRSIQYARYILARSDLDLARFVKMGAKPEQIEMAGNIKFAIVNQQLTQPISLARPYILAASTHADEEHRLAKVWQALQITSHLLVIVPRHVHRRDRICQQLRRLHLQVAVRSRDDGIDARTQIYLADTFGELNGFIAGSDFVFMGGSLVAKGGHNILEVGAQGKAVIFGPHMENFLAERQLFLDQQAGIEVADDAELHDTLRRLLSNPDQAKAIGQRALATMQSQQHILAHYVARLESLITQHSR